ncbi:MAG: hypothetical protein AB1782_11900 [Cyanobacteriota bacterium]
MRFCIILTTCILMFFFSSNCCFAGKINNLNINASGNSKVEIKTTKDSSINNIKIKKEPDSKVIINDKEVDCDEEDTNSGICEPDKY